MVKTKQTLILLFVIFLFIGCNRRINELPEIFFREYFNEYTSSENEYSQTISVSKDNDYIIIHNISIEKSQNKIQRDYILKIKLNSESNIQKKIELPQKPIIFYRIDLSECEEVTLEIKIDHYQSVNKSYEDFIKFGDLRVDFLEKDGDITCKIEIVKYTNRKNGIVIDIDGITRDKIKEIE